MYIILYIILYTLYTFRSYTIYILYILYFDCIIYMEYIILNILYIEERIFHLVPLALYFIQLIRFHKSCYHTEGRIKVPGIAAINKTSKGKGKAIPLQAWTGPEGSKSLRLPDFKTIGTRKW
jgi:hypothetical protein